MTHQEQQPQHRDEPLPAREALRLGTERLRREGIESAALDMSLILAEAMGTNRLGLYLNLDRPLNKTEREAARKMLARRLKREPIAYILGRREFYGLTFEVNPHVLVPRPETELLVEQAVAWIRERAQSQPGVLLADIGTGSGGDRDRHGPRLPAKPLDRQRRFRGGAGGRAAQRPTPRGR